MTTTGPRIFGWTPFQAGALAAWWAMAMAGLIQDDDQMFWFNLGSVHFFAGIFYLRNAPEGST